MNRTLSNRRSSATEASSIFVARFAEEVKNRRQQLGITQGELATVLQSCGVQATQGYISLLEAGQRCDPSVGLVVSLAVLLDISLDELLSTI